MPSSAGFGIHSDVSAVAKLLRLAFQAQSRSVQGFHRRSGSHHAAAHNGKALTGNYQSTLQ
jgi:hypothetical protein